jgi:hypothetical protein
MKSTEKGRIRAMNRTNEITVTIKAVAGKKGEYIAYYTSEFLNATFSVYFRDTIMGAIALQNFSEMLRVKYEKERVGFEVSGEPTRFESKGLMEMMSGSMART